MSADLFNGENEPLPPRFLPREPGVYTPTDHFRKRIDDDTRVVTKEMVEEAIRKGEVREDSAGCWRFVGEVPGMKCHVACGVDERRHVVVVTAYTMVTDAKEAIIDSGFDRHAVKCSAFRDSICTDGWFGDEIRDMSFSPPLEVYGHSIYTESGSTKVRCERCGGVFSRKAPLKMDRCQA